MAVRPSRPSDMTGIHVSEEMVRQLAQAVGIGIAPDHMPGVIRNMEVLLVQTALLLDPPADPLVGPAPVFRP